jgi:hypothetical protein
MAPRYDVVLQKQNTRDGAQKDLIGSQEGDKDRSGALFSLGQRTDYQEYGLKNTRRYHGLIATVIMAHTKNPLRTVMYRGNSAAMSFPAGKEFSKMEEKMAQYTKQAAMKKQPALHMFQRCY